MRRFHRASGRGMIGAEDRMTQKPLDPQLLAALARDAGLERALAQFPDDVAAACAQAQATAGAFAHPTDPAAEPWPPMRVDAAP